MPAQQKSDPHPFDISLSRMVDRSGFVKPRQRIGIKVKMRCVASLSTRLSMKLALIRGLHYFVMLD